MGCDIHGPWIEAKVTWKRYDGSSMTEWQDVATVFTAASRDYQMFEKLAGVRGDEAKAVVAPRGYPADMGWDWKNHVLPLWLEGATDGEQEAMRSRRERYDKGDVTAAYEYTDCHSASWLSADEVDEALVAYHAATGIQNEGWTLVSVIMHYYAMRGQEVRVGFCFDN